MPTYAFTFIPNNITINDGTIALYNIENYVTNNEKKESSMKKRLLYSVNTVLENKKIS